MTLGPYTVIKTPIKRLNVYGGEPVRLSFTALHMHTKTVIFSLIFLLLGGIVPSVTLAKGGGGGGGAIVTNTCANEVRNLRLDSGGNQGGHTTLPDSMHVFVGFSYVPCVSVGRINVEVRDAVTNEVIGEQVTWMNPDPYYSFTWMTPNGPLTTSTWIYIVRAFTGGITYGLSHTPGNAKFSHPYNVVLTGYDYNTGAVTSTVTKSIVTDKQL